MFEKVLIANRGEIALRIHRACKEMGISTVAIHSTVDADAMHVRLADESVCVGPAPAARSYLNAAAILSAATVTNAEAIHPGYGFLAENASFARMVEEHGFTFIGPNADLIALMGDKVAAKRSMVEAGVPVVPGSDGPVEDVDSALAAAEHVGYPVLVKAAAGGGGRGMKVAADQDALRTAVPLARQEAQASFGNPAVFLERFLSHPRHIEVQVLADKHGQVVSLFERDCSLQRKHQKVLEEAPAPRLDESARARIGEVCRKASARIGYETAGTFEFLYQDGEFFFIEMNTRIQVEHPITEMITGIDLVAEMIRVAAGEPLGFAQADLKINGHAIECRINAEDPETFGPSPGRISDFHTPGGLGVRVDSALYSGYSVPPHYDSLVAKLVVHGQTRAACLARLRRALEEMVIGGILTTIPLHQRLVAEPAIVDGNYDIHWLERYVGLK